ncbi:MAG: translocation/assembly module TamB domain-containing protein, partial [Prevotella sp.]|nr:translocation/assembly module TamB domain-containing protein [Prevotella sp.]
FANLDAITMKMNMRAQDYLLVDSKQTRRSIAYGKAFANFFASLSGPIDNLRMMGKLDVLGKTDVTYILKDSPLNTDDQLKDLVTFTDFKDTAHVEVERPPLNGLNMTMMLNVDPGARIMCALNADQSNYVNLEGGGELRMVYNPMDDFQLFGRYTLNQGEMKYELPIIPLKTFKIQEGSYIEFTGDILNPRLNLTATEEVKALVAAETGNSRSVLFNCGVKVTNTLSKMGLEFTLDAPEDMTVKNELAAMSIEQRGKLAVTMLTTGMYLADGNTSGFSMNNALNSFLQSEINNITKSALRTVDLSLGLDQSADGAGNTHTDYSFKFAKRFWNNRINFVIGGKFSSGNDTPSGNQDNTFIDNVSLEYRLDQTAMRYVRLFYNKEADDLLEDRISEYGAGFVWRKKMDALSDLFKSNNQTLLRTTPKATAEGEKKEK